MLLTCFSFRRKRRKIPRELRKLGFPRNHSSAANKINEIQIGCSSDINVTSSTTSSISLVNSSSFGVFSPSDSDTNPMQATQKDLGREVPQVALMSRNSNISASVGDFSEESRFSSMSPIESSKRMVPRPPPPPLPPPRSPSLQQDCRNGASLPKLKALHWEKVRLASDRSMVWDMIRSRSFEFNEEMMECLFGYDAQILSRSETVCKSPSPSPTKSILSYKRLQNITILSKALNARAEQVCDALIQGEGLSMEQLEVLWKMMPTKEEEERLCNHEGEAAELALVEQFIKAMLDIPFAFSRIEAMLYKEILDDEACYLRESLAVLEEACEELRSSRLFLELLQVVLQTGNRMNDGTARGDATAFKLDVLLKLANVRAANGKTTLLHFVAQETIRLGSIGERKESTALDFVSRLSVELQNVKKAASMDLEVLASSVSELLNKVNQIKNLLEDLSVYDGRGNFVESMKSFLNHAEITVNELKNCENRALECVRETVEYYHGQVSKIEEKSLKIFVTVRDFLEILDRECKH